MSSITYNFYVDVTLAIVCTEILVLDVVSCIYLEWVIVDTFLLCIEIIFLRKITEIWNAFNNPHRSLFRRVVVIYSPS